MAAAAVAERLLPPLIDSSADRRANWRLFPLVMAVGYAGGAALAHFSVWWEGRGLLGLVELGPIAKMTAGFVLFELGDYGRHYAFHRVPVLWRLHQVHHSDPALDASSAFRTHPLE